MPEGLAAASALLEDLDFLGAAGDGSRWLGRQHVAVDVAGAPAPRPAGDPGIALPNAGRVEARVAQAARPVDLAGLAVPAQRGPGAGWGYRDHGSDFL